MDAGKIVNYDYMTKGDTTYKPTGSNEKAGTKADKVLTGINDSYYIAPNKQIEGFFGNIYVKSTTDPSVKYFDIPNLNVKVTLLYKRATKQANAEVAIYDGQNKDEYNKGNNEFRLNLTSTGNDAILEKTDQNWKKMFSQNVISFSRDDYDFSELSRRKPSELFNGKYGLDTEVKDKDDPTKFNSLIAHYYVYIVSNAYDIVAMLNLIAHEGSNKTITEAAAAMEFYILNYDPANFTVNGVIPEYVLGEKAPIESAYTYKQVYDFLKQNNSLLASNGYDINSLPNPETEEGKQFLKIRKIDVFSAALNGNDVNFLKLDFSQTDMVSTSIEMNEKYQKQNNLEGNIFWFIPSVMHANHAYVYIDYAVSEFSVSTSNNSFKTSISPSYVTDTLSSGQEASTKLRDQSLFNKMAQYYRFDGAYTGTYQKMVGSSMCLSREDFSNYHGGNNGSGKINSITSTIYIHDYDNNNEYEGNKNYAHDRLLTIQFTYDPVPFWDAFKAIASGIPVFGLVYNFVYDLVTGNIDALLGDLVTGLLNTATGGVLSLVDGIIYAIDTRASLFIGGLVNSSQW